MDLTLLGDQLELLRDALVSAFPEESHLNELLQFDFNTPLANLAQPDAYPAKVLTLITSWAMSQEIVYLLVRRARRRSLRCERLKQFENNYLSPVTTEALVELGNLIRALPLAHDDLISIAHSCVPIDCKYLANAELPHTMEAKIDYLIDLLSGPATPDSGRHIFVELVARITRKTSPKDAIPLNQWLARARLSALPARENIRDMPEAPYLLLRVVPVSTGRARYSVRSWLLGRSRPRNLSEDQGETECDWVGLASLVGALRHQLARIIDDSHYPIEFLVPDDLLTDDFAELQIEEEPGGRKWPLGEMHPVSVRSSTRLMNRIWSRKLQDRCCRRGRLRDLPARDAISGSLSQHVRWIPDDATNSQSTLTAANDARIRGPLIPDAVACALIRLPPDQIPFEVLWHFGIGAALWTRAGYDDGAPMPPEAIEMLIPNGALGSLRTELHERRKSAFAEPGHPARRVTLLWDDPERLPPERVLTNPKRRRELP